MRKLAIELIFKISKEQNAFDEIEKKLPKNIQKET